MWNDRLDEAQVGIKIARRTINNLSYVDDTTLMAESEELKSLLMKVKEESEKVGLILNIQPSNPTSGHTHRGNQIWKGHGHPSVHRSTVYHSQDMEAT